jgi:hypothetical protein
MQTLDHASLTVKLHSSLVNFFSSFPDTGKMLPTGNRSFVNALSVSLQTDSNLSSASDVFLFVFIESSEYFEVSLNSLLGHVFFELLSQFTAYIPPVNKLMSLDIVSASLDLT